MPVDIILNPRSRANRRDPGLAARIKAIAGNGARVRSATDLDRLDDMTVEIAAAPPHVIAIHGGDGTLHKTLSSLLKAFMARGVTLPPIAILPGGTMNVVASSLNLLGRPEAILARLMMAARAADAGVAPDQALPTLARHCLKVEDAYGFVFGNGLMANFLEEYYAKETYGPARALFILGRVFVSGLVGGDFATRIVRPFEGAVAIDGAPLPYQRLTGVGAGTVREVGMGFKLNHRADDDPERFCFVAIHGGPVSLGLDLPGVHRGVGLHPKRAHVGLGRSLRIEPANGAGCLYTVDGDLYRKNGPVSVELGPALRIFKWR